ncbi:MAG: type IX secretion system outer membrane channel protein PorV [Flavobacteriales bacterium]|nr:type IX secretion system outer membrane channel protein PorV [Flavobacteriales bacterium]
MPSIIRTSLQTAVALVIGAPFTVLAQPCDPQFQAAGQQCGDQLNTITTAVPFLMISVDSRAGGMGDAGVAVSPDANSIHWNPSKLAFAENDGEFSMSYSPWLRNLVPDMSLAYLAGYKRLGNKRSTVGASLRYFNLGSILFTDVNGSTIRDFKPAEFAVDLAFAQQFGDNFSGGVAIRYINSNLTGGISVQGANSKAGQSVAADVSFFYQKKEMQLGDREGSFALGLNISNVGARMSYTDAGTQDFIPINLRLGPAFTLDMDEYNSLTFAFDVNKLLVPTPPVYLLDEDGAVVIDPATDRPAVASGRDPNVGVATGIFGSFSDAPGNVSYDDNGNVVVEAGSPLREELREVNLSGGLEYWYAKQFAFRTGYFYEHYTKGNRKYFTLGAGLRYNIFSLDLSYLIANAQRSPLANTLRFTLGFRFDGKGGKKKPVE